jgi:transcriptional regulator with XRE-family HTH domain
VTAVPSSGGSGSARASRPLRDELPRLLDERRLTLRALARSVGVDHAHLSRVLRQRDGKRPTAELAVRIAKALELPEDFFVEFREAAVVEAVRQDGALRDDLYDRFVK